MWFTPWSAAIDFCCNPYDPDAPALPKGYLHMSRSNLSHGELSGFCTQIALMLGAGLPVYDGMEALTQAAQSGAEREVYARLSAALNETGSLSEAMRRDGCWPAYLVEMTAIGERAGRLENVMNSLAAHYEREGRIQRAVRSAVTYPLVLCVMLLAIILIMIVKVLPVFKRVLGGMGVAMTQYGEWMMRTGATIGWVMLGVTVAVLAAVVICALLLRTGAREGVLRFINRCFPPLRRLNRRISGARMASVLSMMLSGGFPLDEALEMVPSVLEDEIACGKVSEMRGKIAEGKPFADAIVESEMFDEFTSGLIRTSAAVGSVDAMMEKVAADYENRAEEGIASLVSIIEPTLVAVLSVVIGAVLLSVMLPMAGIISSIL